MLEDELSGRLDALGEGDVSVLEASLKNPDSKMMTVESSATYAL